MAADDNGEAPANKVDEAMEFLRRANDAEAENRQNGLTALQFRYGDQWPQYAIASRGLERPQLTINETNTYIRKVTSAQRQQRPRGKASPVDSKADPKIAKVITGLGRHIEVNSDADYAYDTAFDFAATIGWGYWRLRTEYTRPDSFDQEIVIDPCDNPFSVYFDYNSRLPDGSDAEKALITSLLSKASFRKMYPGAQDNGFSDRGTGDSDPDWVTTTDIRLAEYYFVDRKPETLVMLSDGTPVWESDLPRIKRLLVQAGIGIIGDRKSFRRIVKWRKQTGFEILEEKIIPGRWIPVVPVYWSNVIIDSRRCKFGLVKDAMDPARMNNFWQTAITEALALAPKAKWLIAEGADEGHENEFKNANLAPSPTLHYKTTGVDGREIPPPQRIAPEMPPAGFIEASFMATQSLSRVMGIFDPAVRGGAQHKSDKTLNAERAQSESTNYEGYDNLTRSIKHSWRIMLSWFPSVYKTPGRVARIIGEDGREKVVTLNERQTGQDETGAAIEKVLNDVTVGEYDVVMQTGPGYDTRRQEGVAAMIELMATPLGAKVAQVADDLIVRSMDFPGADVIADRLAASNPIAQIDEMSEVPPAVQMKLKAQEGMIQQLQTALQAAEIEKKAHSATAEINAHAKVLAAKIQAEGDREEREVTARATVQEAETHALTAQNVAEINALARILTSKGEQAHDLRKMIATFAHESEQKERDRQAQAAAAEPQPAQGA